MTVVASLEIEMLANMARLQSDMDKAKRTVGGAMQQIERDVERVKGVLGSLGVGLGVGYFASLIKGSIDAADHLNDLSKSTNIAVGDLAGLKLLAAQTGTDLDGLAKGINKMSVEMGKNPEKFRALGITAKDNTGALKQFSDLFNQLPDINQRNALSQAVFSKSWQEFAPALSEGSLKIGETIEKGKALSKVNAEMAEAADAVNDKWAELVGTGGLVNGVTAKLLPVINLLLDGMIDLRGSTNGTSESFSYLTEALKAIVVFGGNVAFTLKGVGTEIGGIAAQVASLGRADLGGAFRIGAMMKEDAATARKEFDAWESRVMSAGKTFSNRYSQLAAEAGDPLSFATNAQSGKAASARASAFLADGKGGKNSGVNDGINAQIEELKKFQAIKELIAKQTVDRVNSEYKRGMLTEIDMINQVAAAEKYAITSSIATLEQEKAIAAQKVNSKKEVASIESNIAQARERLTTRELQQGYALLELEFRIAAERQALYNKADQDIRTSVDALREKNKATEREIEEIGLTANQLSALTLARQNDTIAAQQQKIAVMRIFGDGESSAAIDLEIEKLNELTKARDLSVKAQDKKEVSLELKGYDLTASQLESLSNITGKMGDGFKKATTALSGFASAFKSMSATQKNESLTMQQRQEAQIGGYADMAGAAKNFFEEGTEGYELLSTVEQAFRAVQMAMSIAAMVQNATETTAVVAESAVRTTAKAAEGGATMFAQSGWGGFAGVAAMIAVLAALGASMGGSGGGGGKSGAGGGAGANGRFAESGYVLTDNGRIGQKAPLDYTSNDTAGYNPEYGVWIETEAAADKAYTALRAANGGLSDLEQRLVDVKTAVQGTGRSIYESATDGMSEAEASAYNYNASLRMQADVLVDIANGTNHTSDKMRELAQESEQLAIDLMRASGDIAGARRAQALVDTRGYSAEEIAVYNYNQQLRDQIAAAEAGASAAADAAQAERDLAQSRYELAGRVNILLGRQTQQQFDRATELGNTTDEASISMLKMIYALEDLNAAVDANYATLERSIAKEKELATVRLNSAKEVQALLKSSVSSSTIALTRSAAQDQLRAFLAAAKASGIMPSAEALKPSLTAISKPSEELFSTFTEYQLDFARTSNDIRDMATMADRQVSVEQQTIDALNQTLQTAKDQLDVMRGVDTSVKDVASAFGDFSTSMQAFAEAKAVAPVFNFTMPTGGSSGGGGYYGGGSYGGGGVAAGSFEDIAGQSNIDIVAAYRAYYNRNPDEGGYNTNVNSGLKGDALMKSILRGSAANKDGADYQTAISKGFDPNNPDAKFLKSILNPTGTSSSNGGSPYLESFAVGVNEVPYDMIANIHQGEEITPKPYVDLQRSSRDETNRLMARLVQSNEQLTAEVKRMQLGVSNTAANTAATQRTLENLTDENGGNAMTVKVST